MNLGVINPLLNTGGSNSAWDLAQRMGVQISQPIAESYVSQFAKRKTRISQSQPQTQNIPIPQVTQTQVTPVSTILPMIAEQSTTVAPVSSSGANTLAPQGSDYMTMFEAAKSSDITPAKLTPENQSVSTGSNTMLYLGLGLAGLFLLTNKRKRN